DGDRGEDVAVVIDERDRGRHIGAPALLSWGKLPSRASALRQRGLAPGGVAVPTSIPALTKSPLSYMSGANVRGRRGFPVRRRQEESVRVNKHPVIRSQGPGPERFGEA